ncbi:MAG: hypothetical protein JJ902_14920 [Roseibium sp.]|nr:hypothetical protein [Roseibium sp.]
MIDLMAFRVAAIAIRKKGSECSNDFRYATSTVAVSIPGTSETIKAKPPKGGALPPAPETPSKPEEDFNKLVSPYWAVSEFVIDESGKTTGQPAGYVFGASVPSLVRYKHNISGAFNRSIPASTRKSLFNQLSKKLISGRPIALNLDFSGPFYCSCKKDKACKAKLIKIHVSHKTSPRFPKVTVHESGPVKCDKALSVKAAKKLAPRKKPNDGVVTAVDTTVFKFEGGKYGVKTLIFDVIVPCPCQPKETQSEGDTDKKPAKKPAPCRAEIHIQYWYRQRQPVKKPLPKTRKKGR